jgi:hypothetical protein
MTNTVNPLRHLRAFATLPFVVTVVIPSVLHNFVTRSKLVADHLADSMSLWGLGLFGAGLSALLYTNVLFHREGKGTLAPFDPPTKFVVTGAYRYSRNPMIGTC